jgi:hypothetical protein
VIGENPRQALVRNVLGQQRVIGRMVDGIGEPHEREHRDEHPERVDEARDRDGARPQEQAADQVHSRIGAVDEEADRGLHHGRHRIEGRKRKTELGIAHAVIRTDEDEQRREQHDEVVARHVREAHAGHELRLARARGDEDVGGWGHFLRLSSCCCREARGADQAVRAPRAS